ncbi:TetR family transcriptional regulator [Kibdelosporangium philippinense]|uniref:TetR family transcriptional regulator n=1 Tax=Kibdelosporangium philippinense TaxID=211113 RepID=A0ABS8ZVA0_9PSEU|nr:TetR family transcriptional regulator C-terminal domain-containing protein [Kibdelosporangium philippinense]MCE7011527.1 TetR family transcriptional regulator [Kibdelosporangium philippinense]
MVSQRTRGVGAAHDERQHQIVDAVLELIAEQGLDGISLRDVAAKADVSLGRVQHYFRTKDQMLQAAFQRVTELGAALVDQRLADAGDSSPRTVIRAIAAELLPIDDLHRHALQVGMAFTARAVVAEHFAARLQTGYGELRDLLAVMLTTARTGGATRPDLDPQHEAHVLLGLIDGLATQTLIGHHTPETALAVVDTYLDRIFTT